MEISAVFMDKNNVKGIFKSMNEITICNSALPVWCGGGHLTTPEEFVHADRVLPFHVLIYVKNGCIYVTEEETDYAVEHGELLFLKAGLHHFGKHYIPKGTEWYYMHFYMDGDAKAAAPYEERFEQDRLLLYRLSIPKYVQGLAGSDTERRIIESVDFANSREAGRQWFTNERLFRLLSHIAMRQNSVEPRLTDRVAEYLSEHYREKICFSELAASFYISYQRLAALFTAEKGVSMGEYVKRLRLEEAAGLLCGTLISIVEIAAKVGYQDALYFSKQFSRHFGLSPREYRMKPREY